MENLTKEYLHLFNAITDTIEDLEELKQKLMQSQAAAEALYIEDEAFPLLKHA